MASDKIRECCKPGVVWEGTPAGKEITIAGVPAYAGPTWETSDAPVVVVLVDVYGYEQKNLRLYCDQLEKIAGVRAIGPNIMGDTAMKPDDYPDGVPRFLELNPLPQRLRQVQDIVAACDSSKVGLLGFCWGAKPCVLAAATKESKLAAVACNHPSLLTQEEVEALAVPAFMNFSGPDDPMVSPEQRVSFAKALDSQPDCGSEYFATMQHGWTLKGDDKDAQVQECAAKALENNVRFFQKLLMLAS